MNEETKEAIHAVLTLLKDTLVKNGVSMATNKDGELLFFDTAEYLRTKRFKGMKVSIQDLVR